MSELPHDTGANVDDYNERIRFLEAQNRGLMEQVVTYETARIAMERFTERTRTKATDVLPLDQAVRWLLAREERYIILGDDFARLKHVATAARENQYACLQLLRRCFGWLPDRFLPRRIRRLRDSLKRNIEKLNAWGCHP